MFGKNSKGKITNKINFCILVKRSSFLGEIVKTLLSRFLKLGMFTFVNSLDVFDVKQHNVDSSRDPKDDVGKKIDFENSILKLLKDGILQ